MYYDAEQYVALFIYELAFNYVTSLEKKYGNLPALHFIFESLKKFMVYEPNRHRLVVSWQSYAQQENLADSSWPELSDVKAKARETLDGMRSQLDAADYLLLRMTVTDDEKEGDLLFKEDDPCLSGNILVRIVACFGAENDENIIDRFYRLKDELGEQCAGKEYHDFFELVSLVHDFRVAPEKVDISRLQYVLTLEPVYSGLLYTLFWDAMGKADSQKLLDIMHGVDMGMTYVGKYVDILKCHLWYKTGELPRALRVIEKLDLEKLRDDDLIDCLNLKARLYHATGQGGKAMLIWEEIVKNEDFRSSMNDNYYDALIQLASAKAVAGEPATARELLGANGETDTNLREFMVEYLGSDYFLMCGNIFLAEKNREKAVKMYNRSLAIADNPQLREKVKLVELDLW